ncbi:hypothetical protein OROMI_004310 [Orobanche minor]
MSASSSHISEKAALHLLSTSVFRIFYFHLVVPRIFGRLFGELYAPFVSLFYYGAVALRGLPHRSVCEIRPGDFLPKETHPLEGSKTRHSALHW